jgi:hypothetical protein
MRRRMLIRLGTSQGIASILCLVMQVLLLGYFKGFHGEETMRTVRIKEGLFGFACIMWIAALIPATVSESHRCVRHWSSPSPPPGHHGDQGWCHHLTWYPRRRYRQHRQVVRPEPRL